MKIYTKTGDRGDTGLFGGPRVSKDDIRIEAYGTVDELNAFLGQARTESLPAEVEATLVQVQNDLFVVGAELATPDAEKQRTAVIDERAVVRLETAIDRLQEKLPPLREFILPGGNRGAAALHVARGVSRRAERRVVTLSRTAGATVSDGTLRYLNRLSDYLFVAARAANFLAETPETRWQKPPTSE